MRGRKSYNIRNIEAHLNNIRPKSEQQDIRQLLFNNQIHQINKNNQMIYKNNESQLMNEYVNAKYGVSRYASNQVSGKMFNYI